MESHKFEVFVSREKSPDLVSRMIMRRIGADFSHIGIVLNSTHVWHATGDGVNFETVGRFLEKREFVEKFPIKVQNGEFARGYMVGSLLKEYSQSQYLGFLVPSLRSFLGNKAEKTICSELVMDFIRDVCWPVPSDWPRAHDFVNPKEALEWAKKVRA